MAVALFVGVTAPLPIINTAAAPLQSLVRVWMNDHDTGWAESATELLHTANGGKSWQGVLSLTNRLLGQVAVTSGSQAAVMAPDGNHSLMYEQTTSGGLRWSRDVVRITHASDNTPLEVTSLDPVPKTSVYALVRTDEGMNSPEGMLLRSVDSGRSWTVMASTGAGARLPSAIGAVSFSGLSMGWLAASSTTTSPTELFETATGGGHWEQVALPSSGQGHDVNVVGLPELVSNKNQWIIVGDDHGSAPSTGYVFTTKLTSTVTGFFYKEGNCDIYQGPTGDLLSPVFLSTVVGWEWDSGRLFATYDGGARWQKLATLPGQLLTLQLLSRNLGWALVREDGRSVLFRSDSGGSTWQVV